MAVDPRMCALDSLHGLGLGDALGSQFFYRHNYHALYERRVPPGPWSWTDDTEMACSIYAVLCRFRSIDQDALAASFAERYDSARKYGTAMNRLLRQVREGGAWRELAGGLFGGQGSWGNGAAMRVAPLGGWFAEDPGEAARQAMVSAAVTHTHPEAVAGAVAVAVAAALAAGSGRLTPRAFLDAVGQLTPSGRVHGGIGVACDLVDIPSVAVAVEQLGNGRNISALDTVPFALWAAARNLDDYEEAIWTTASAGGDVDTTCAIVGGIVAARVGRQGLPAAWRSACEPLPAWVDSEK